MRIITTVSAICVAMAAASAAQAGQIGVGDFTSPTIVGFGSPNPTATIPAPLTIGPATFTDANGSNLRWWAPGNGYNDCIGGCVTTDSGPPTALNVALSGGYSLAGLYVGQATPYSLTVSFFDASSNLLGSVVAAGASDGVTFAGWRSDAAKIASISIAASQADGFVVSAQSGYFQANAVPEPAAWAMMIGGFAMAGAALRRNRAGAKRATVLA